MAAWVQDSTGGAPGRLREELASCWRDAEQAERCCWDRSAALHHSDDRWRHSLPSTECRRQAPGCSRAALRSQQHLRKPSPTTSVSPTVTMRSASTVDAAIERTCAGDAHGPQAAVSAIGRGRWGRWQRVRARTAAALRNARDHSVWVMYGFPLGTSLRRPPRVRPRPRRARTRHRAHSPTHLHG